MTAIAVQALVTMLLGGAAFLFIAQRQGPNGLRPPLLAVLGFLVPWMAGRLIVEVADTDAIARAGNLISYLGASGLGPSWLFLAARFTRSQLFERQPGLLAAACVPPALAYLALLTNDGHRLFGSVHIDLETLRSGTMDWGGPVFWMALAWQLILVMTGIGMFARYASSSLSGPRRLHAQAIALAGCFPVIATLCEHLGAFPSGVNPTPITTGLAIIAIIAIAVRYRLLDFLPLARRDIIDALDDGVILADGDGLILDLNPAAKSLLGSTRPLRDQPLARTLARLTPDDEWEATEHAIEQALEAGASVPLKTRQERELEIRVGSVLDSEGEPSARFAVVRDLTESRRYDRLLRESQQRVVVGGLAAGLAHEVNNPLAFVASNLRQIHRVANFEKDELEHIEANRAAELSELSEVVAETIEGVERIAGIVGRIIRPGALSQDDLVRLDLGRVVHDAVRLVELHAHYTGRTAVAPMDALPQIEGCPERLSQALLNLLLNAQQVAEPIPDATLCVDAVADDGRIALRLGVRDADGNPWTGSLPSISSTGGETAEAELSAAYETVREHGGTLESGGEPGRLFVMRLPVAG